jgi:hypothetical protein
MKHSKSTSLKKTALTAAMAVALGTTGLVETRADTYTFSFSGLFTMLDPAGAPLQNSSLPYYYDPTWSYGRRTQITGTVTYDDVAGTGSATINNFEFFNGTAPAVASGVTFTNIGNGGVGGSNLLLGNMLFNWSGNNGIPVSIVWDASGMIGELGPALSPGNVITGVGATPASNGIKGGTIPLGATPIATTTWDTTPTAQCIVVTPAPSLPPPDGCMTVNPSGTLPLIANAIGGSPMRDGPFAGYNANFDITSMTVSCIDSGSGPVCGPPGVQTTLPADGAVNFGVESNITTTFTQAMNAATVEAGFTLVETAVPGTPIAVTVTSASGDTVFTFNPNTSLKYSTQYTATLADTVEDALGQPMAAAYTWIFTTRAQPTGQFCSTPSALVPLGSNFTMLDPAGTPFGGTNDVEYDFGNGLNSGHNPARLNTQVTGTPGADGTLGIDTNILRTAGPWPFFAFVWSAHHIRLFDEGTYIINTECTVNQLENGACVPNADSAKNLIMTVGAGQIGAHMLFDWNVSSNIDVVNVWDVNAIWDDPDAGVKNDLWTSARWAGPAGVTVDPDTMWDYVSTDSEGDVIIGVKMLDGPFIGYSANFNLGPASSCVGSSTVTVDMEISEDTKVAGGCSLSRHTTTLVERGDWWLIAGFLAWLGLVRRRFLRQRT